MNAEQNYRQALALAPDDVVALANLGLLLASAQRLEEAERLQRAALALLPHNAKLHANLANLLAELGRDAQSEHHHQRSLQLDPLAAISWSNLGVFLATRGHEARAEACLRRALDLQRDHARARYNLAYLLLRQGRLREGWRQHEARYAPNLPAPGSLPPALPFPQWRGQDLAGKSLLIWPEQGLGDEIQFCRYAPLLKARGATTVTWVCREPLRRLLGTLAGVDQVLSVERAQAGVAMHDYWSFALSLPLHCNTLPGRVPATIPYLHPSATRQRLPEQHGLRVGLVWRGNPHNPCDADRSLPALSTLRPLWSIDGVSFVSLQKGAGTAEAAAAPAEMPLLEMGSRLCDFADSASLLAQLDLLISVDTAVAHLAGAMGKPCWLLLPAYMPDWRWLSEGEQSPWYPCSHRLFRQPRRGDWTSVVERLVGALAELAQRPAPALEAIGEMLK